MGKRIPRVPSGRCPSQLCSLQSARAVPGAGQLGARAVPLPAAVAGGCCVPGAASPCSVPQLRTIPQPLCRPTGEAAACHSRVPASLHLLTVISGLWLTRPSCGNLVNKHERWPGTPRHLFLWAVVAISSPELCVSCCYFSLCRLHPFPRGLGSGVPVPGWPGLSAVRRWRWASRGAVPRSVSPHQVPSRWLGLLPGSAEPRGGCCQALRPTAARPQPLCGKAQLRRRLRPPELCSWVPGGQRRPEPCAVGRRAGGVRCFTSPHLGRGALRRA